MVKCYEQCFHCDDCRQCSRPAGCPINRSVRPRVSSRRRPLGMAAEGRPKAVTVPPTRKRSVNKAQSLCALSAASTPHPSTTSLCATRHFFHEAHHFLREVCQSVAIKPRSLRPAKYHCHHHHHHARGPPTSQHRVARPPAITDLISQSPNPSPPRVRAHQA